MTIIRKGITKMGNEKDLPIVDSKATGENIKRLMRLKKITISQLQVKLGMASATNIYAWCRGKYVPSTDRLLQLAYIFGCKVDDILVAEEK